MIKGSALPLEKGLNKITSGTDIKAKIARCDVDGTLTVTWPDNTTSVETFIAGEDRDMSKSLSVSITTGTFSFSTSEI